jgi:hypothetical protein
MCPCLGVLEYSTATEFVFFSDFDEQTADDWDVDMSEYYDPGSGDMDAKALVTMEREKRRRAGIVDPDDHIFSSKIGKFEKFTKVSKNR